MQIPSLLISLTLIEDLVSPFRLVPMGWSDVSTAHLLLLPVLWLSVLLYLYLIFKILRARRANSSLFISPFFALVLGQAVWDLSTFFVSFFLVFCRRYMMLPFVEVEDGLFPKLLYFLQTVLPNCLYLNSVLLAASRLSAFKWPIWTVKHISICHVLIAILASVNVGRLFIGNPVVSLRLIAPGRMKMFQDENLLVQDSYQDLVLSIGCCLTCTLFYSWSAWKSGKIGLKNMRYQRKFLRCAITVFLPYIPNAIKSFLLIYAGYTNNDVLTSYCIESWLFVIYLMCLLQPWVLLSQHPRIRPTFGGEESSEQSHSQLGRTIDRRLRSQHENSLSIPPIA